MLDKLLSLRKNKPALSDDEKNAKISALKGLSQAMGEETAGKLKGLKKVTVASNSPQGLKEGLNKAEDMVSQSDAPLGDDMEPKYCDEHSSLEEINSEMERLQSLKDMKMSEDSESELE